MSKCQNWNIGMREAIRKNKIQKKMFKIYILVSLTKLPKVKKPELNLRYGTQSSKNMLKDAMISPRLIAIELKQFPKNSY